MKQRLVGIGLLGCLTGAAALVAGCTSGHERPEVSVTAAALTAEQCEFFEVDGKVQICHRTASKKNPYTIIRVNLAGCVAGHAGHDGDYVAVGDPTCNGEGCFPVTAPCDDDVPCCDGLSCMAGYCTACPAGTYEQDGSCLACPPGTVQPAEGQLTCDACPDGTWDDGSEVCASCDDGDACTVDACDVIAGPTYTALDYDDGDACTVDACDPATGPLYTALDYDDGDACTDDFCSPATGPFYEPVDLDDGDACTTDLCDPASGPYHVAVDPDDGDACTIDRCDPALGPVYVALDYADDDACTVDSCDPAVGPVHVALDYDDANACTLDTCDPATGPSHAAIDPNDGDVCTVDGCDPATGVSHAPVTCGANASCAPSVGCVCDAGFVGDGTTCVPDAPACPLGQVSFEGACEDMCDLDVLYAIATSEDPEVDCQLSYSSSADVVMDCIGDDMRYYAGSGNDTVSGLDGDDIICGDGGNDTLSGGTGDDYLFGNESMDTLYGGDGDDYLFGGTSADIIHGDAGNDVIFGGQGGSPERLYGDAGDDLIFADAGNIRVHGGPGADVIAANATGDSMTSNFFVFGFELGVDHFGVAGERTCSGWGLYESCKAYTGCGDMDASSLSSGYGCKYRKVDSGTVYVVTFCGAGNIPSAADLNGPFACVAL